MASIAQPSMPSSPEIIPHTTETNAPPTGHTLTFRMVPISHIGRDPAQPRRSITNIDGLVSSIRAHGILEPLLVCVADEDSSRYLLVAGERRLAAAEQLGLPEVPVVVRSKEAQSQLAIQLVENLQREDLHVLDEALGIHRLMAECQISQREAGRRLGKPAVYINELLRLLVLPEEVLMEIRTSEQPVSKSVLLEISKTTDPQHQAFLWNLAQAGNLTVQQARESRGVSVELKADRSDEGDKKASRSNTRTWSIGLTGAKVSVQLRSEEAFSLSLVRQALSEAIKGLEPKAIENLQ